MGSIRGTVSATGVISALPGADFVVSISEPARIVEISRKVGDRVKSGDLLVRFEFPSLRAEGAARAATTKNAEIRLQAAKLAQARVHPLIDRGAASQKEADDADRDVSDAEAELSQARASQSATEALGQHAAIRAPFDGVVAERLHDAGDMVGALANDPVLRIVDPRQVEVVATVAIADVARFAIGASGRVIAEGQAPQVVRVTSRPEAERGATTVPVRLTFDLPTELAPGTQAGIEIDAEQRSNVALVPATAIVRDAANNAAVWVAAGNQAMQRPVTTGLAGGVNMEITSGVRAGELVIVQGQSDLRNGMAITVSPR
jgi:RND family efflux transporter MFP subunit